MKRDIYLIVITAVVTSILSCSSLGLYFYFNTNFTLNAHTVQISETQKDVKKLQEDNVNNKIVLASLQELKNNQESTKEDVKEMRKELYNFIQGYYNRVPRR